MQRNMQQNLSYSCTGVSRNCFLSKSSSIISVSGPVEPLCTFSLKRRLAPTLIAFLVVAEEELLVTSEIYRLSKNLGQEEKFYFEIQI